MREKILKMLQDFYDTDGEDFTVTVNFYRDFGSDYFGKHYEHYTVNEAIIKIEDDIKELEESLFKGGGYSLEKAEESAIRSELEYWENNYLVRERKFKNKKYHICFDKENPQTNNLMYCSTTMMDAKSPKDAAEQYAQGKVKRVSGEEARHADIIVESERAYYCYNRA